MDGVSKVCLFEAHSLTDVNSRVTSMFLLKATKILTSDRGMNPFGKTRSSNECTWAERVNCSKKAHSKPYVSSERVLCVGGIGHLVGIANKSLSCGLRQRLNGRSVSVCHLQHNSLCLCRGLRGLFSTEGQFHTYFENLFSSRRPLALASTSPRRASSKSLDRVRHLFEVAVLRSWTMIHTTSFVVKVGWSPSSALPAERVDEVLRIVVAIPFEAWNGHSHNLLSKSVSGVPAINVIVERGFDQRTGKTPR